MKYDAMVLAGGEGRRLGGARKAEILLGGRTMIEHVLAAVAGAARVVVVGPDTLARPGVATVLEEPPLGGPVAGIAAGLSALGEAGDVPVAVLACDMPRIGRALPGLLTALETGEAAPDGVVLTSGGHLQPLAGVYRRAALRAALQRCAADGGVWGASMRRLVSGMRLAAISDTSGASRDGDTWQDVAELRRTWEETR